MSLLLVLLQLAAPVLGADAPPDARRIDSGRYTVVFYAADAVLAASALESAVARDSFPFLPRSRSRVVIMIAPDAATFREWAGQSAFPWAAALAFVEQHRVVMQGRSASSDAGNPLQVLRHELAHIALYDFIGLIAPRWFEEGYASYAAGEERTDGFIATNAALAFRTMPSLAALDTMLANRRGTDARAGYALALRAVSDLAALDRQRGLAPLLSAWRERGSFDLAMRRAYAQTADQFERDWQRRTRWQFAFLALAADSAFVTALFVLLLVPLYQSRRRRNAARLAAMREREATTEHAMRSAALDAVLHAVRPAERRPERDA